MDLDSFTVKCRQCGHVEEAHNFYSRCEGTLSQPDCRCLATPAEVRATNA